MDIASLTDPIVMSNIDNKISLNCLECVIFLNTILTNNY